MSGTSDLKMSAAKRRRIESLKAKQASLTGVKRPSPAAPAPDAGEVGAASASTALQATTGPPVAAAAAAGSTGGQQGNTDAYKTLAQLELPTHLSQKLHLHAEKCKGSIHDLLEELMQQNMPLATAQSMLAARILDKQVMLSNPTAALPQVQQLPLQRVKLSGGILTRSQRQALTTLPGHMPAETLAPLSNLWHAYMQKLLQDKPNKLQYCLQHADWHGSTMTVVSSKVPQHVGVQGVVVKATVNTVVLVGQDGRPVTVPLQGCFLKCCLYDGTELLLDGGQLSAARRELAAKHKR